MKRTLLTIAFALSLSLMLLTAVIYETATTNWIMLPLMERFAPPENTRLPAEEYAPVVDMITDYLLDRTDTFQHVFAVDENEFAAFNQKEQQHMADVQALFQLCRTVAWLCHGVFLILLILLKHIHWRTFRRTLLVILAAVTVIILLAAIDFNSLFILFHKVAFTNDLWLLDPQTDLLIRLMPIEFFISYAAIIGGIWLLGMVGLLVLSTIRIKKMDKGE